MVIVPIVRASLGPLFFVIFAANSLPDDRVAHIDDSEQKATQMGEVRNPRTGSLYGREEFNKAEDNDKIFGRDGEEEVDVDETVWKKPTVGQK
jgi:hypothetical protein